MPKITYRLLYVEMFMFYIYAQYSDVFEQKLCAKVKLAYTVHTLLILLCSLYIPTYILQIFIINI